MNTRSQMSSRIRMMCLVAMFMAVEFVMWLAGLGQVPVGPLNMSFLTVPVAVGGMLLGPAAGAVLGATFGMTSFLDAVTGKSLMTSTFFNLQPVATFMLCVGMRVLMGWVCGLFFKAIHRVDKHSFFSWYLGGLSAPLLNTFFFMGFIVLFFYQTELVQNLVSRTGATNPVMFVILLVGFQGLVEAIVCTVVAGTAAKGVSKALKWDKAA